MKIVYLAAVLIFLGLFLSYPQTEFQFNRIVESDSGKFNLTLNPFLQREIFPDDYIFLNEQFLFNEIIADTQNTRQFTRMMLSNPQFWQNSYMMSPKEMISPLTTKFLQDNKHQGFKYMLGLLQGAAVGYLAIKHISKYGFLRKKEEK
ncbi:MAG: hypothetical protein AB9882_11690 [Ignavibacteriaceae bacterium]